MSRKLVDLSPATYKMWVEFDRRMRVAGIEYVLTCTYRSEAEQAELFKIGRTLPGKIVTNAPPGMSAHNAVNSRFEPASEAFDVVPVEHGKLVWDKEAPVWQRVGEIGEACGLQWAGRWKTFQEYPHFQNPEWRKPT